MTVSRLCLPLALLLTFGAALPVAAIEPATGRHTVLYSSSGPGRPDGYENAQVNLQYQFTDCPGGITLGLRVIPNAVTVSPRYWHQGQQLVPSEPAPKVERVEVVADVMYRGSRIARLSFLGNHHASTGSRLGCGGLTVGRFPDFLPAGYTEADKVQMFRELVVWTSPSPNTLTNPAIGRRRIDAERQKAEAQRQAQERAANTERERSATSQKPAPALAPPASQTAPAPVTRESGAPRQPTDAQLQAQIALESLERQRREERRRVERQIDQGAQNIANHLTLESARRNTGRRIAALTRFGDDIESSDELNAEYQQRLEQINAEIDRYVAQQHAASSNVHRAFDDQAVGMATQKFVQVMQQHNANSARNEAREQLERERQRMLAHLEERRSQAVLAGRQALVDEFQDATLPRYADSIEGNVIYYFAYALDQAQIGLTRISPPVYLTNVFPVVRRGDGGWPLRQRLDTELAQVMPQGQQAKLAGVFLSEREAQQTRDAFVRLANQSQLAVQALNYERKVTQTAAASVDFWGGGTSSRHPAASAPDFWGAGDATPSPSTPSVPDFWDDGGAAPSNRPAASSDTPDFWR